MTNTSRPDVSRDVSSVHGMDAARADMRVEVVKREINQGALAGMGSAITDYAALLIVNALDSFDEEAAKAEYRSGFEAGMRNAHTLLGQWIEEMPAPGRCSWCDGAP